MNHGSSFHLSQAPQVLQCRAKTSRHSVRMACVGGDPHISTTTGWQQTSIGKRRHELMVPRGFVERAKDADGDEIRRLSPSGSPSLVWALTKAGRDYYTEVCRVRD